MINNHDIEKWVNRAKDKSVGRDAKLKASVSLPEPFLGHLLIETERESVVQYFKERAGQTEDSLIVLPQELLETKYDVPIRRGVILKKAPDCFGKWFKDKYGEIGYLPQEGDTILFTSVNATYIDPDRKFSLLPEQAIQGYWKKEENKDE